MGTSSGIEPRSRWHGGLVLAYYSRLTMFVTTALSLPGFGRLYTEPESEVKSSTCSLLCLVMKSAYIRQCEAGLT